jgi:hypothetical protein
MRIATTSGLIRRLFAFTAAAAWCGGCSLLFHADAQQCTTNTDCTSREEPFTNTICKAGICVPTTTPEAGSDTGKSDAHAETGTDANVDAGTPCPNGYSDCMSLQATNFSQAQFACDHDTNTCVQLTSTECPYVLGDYMETLNIPPIFVGAFATFPVDDPTSDPSYQNYELAINEFKAAGGIPIGPGGSVTRMPVAILCNDVGDTAQSVPFLAAAHVTSLVAALDSATLKTTFANYGFGQTFGDGNKGLFFVNPFGADSTLTALSRGQQLWHMLGVPSDLTSAYVTIMPRIEHYIRNNSPWNLGPTAPMRVAVVQGNAQVLDDLASAVENAISWNNGTSNPSISGGSDGGPPATYNAQSISISSLNASDNASTYNYNTVVSNLLAFMPHVIISFGADEFVFLLEQLELQWTPAQGPLPFYLLSPYNAFPTGAGLQQYIGPASSPQAKDRLVRFAGINYASPTSSVFAPYQANFVQEFNPDGGTASPGANNNQYYDAMYFAIDSLIGAGKVPPISGADVGEGMLNLINRSNPVCDMGPVPNMACVFNALDKTPGNVSLLGTLGPPSFDPTTGARESQGDVYCMLPQPAVGDGGVAMIPTFDYDVLRLVPGADGGFTWEGTFPCYGGF